MLREKIKTTIQEALPDAQIIVENPQEDDVHFEAIVISATFESMSLVKQHQTVMNALKTDFGNASIHALALKTFTPEKWANTSSS